MGDASGSGTHTVLGAVTETGCATTRNIRTQTRKKAAEELGSEGGALANTGPSQESPLEGLERRRQGLRSTHSTNIH